MKMEKNVSKKVKHVAAVIAVALGVLPLSSQACTYVFDLETKVGKIQKCSQQCFLSTNVDFKELKITAQQIPQENNTKTWLEFVSVAIKEIGPGLGVFAGTAVTAYAGYKVSQKQSELQQRMQEQARQSNASNAVMLQLARIQTTNQENPDLSASMILLQETFVEPAASSQDDSDQK